MLDISEGLVNVKRMEAVPKLIIRVKLFKQLLPLAIAFFVISAAGIGSYTHLAGSNFFAVVMRVCIGFVPLYYVLKTKVVAKNGKLTVCEMLHTESIDAVSIKDMRIRTYQWNRKVLEIYGERTKQPLIVKLSYFETDALSKVVNYIANWNPRLPLHESLAE
jgi:hypothetical protein